MKTRTGTKLMGRSWNGRMCCAVMRVAKSVGGSGFSVVPD